MSGNGVKKERFWCAVLKAEKRVSISPVRADQVFGYPGDFHKRVVFASVFRTDYVLFFGVVGLKM